MKIFIKEKLEMILRITNRKFLEHFVYNLILSAFYIIQYNYNNYNIYNNNIIIITYNFFKSTTIRYTNINNYLSTKQKI